MKNLSNRTSRTLFSAWRALQLPIILLLLMLPVPLPAAPAAEPDSPRITAVDALGRTVELQGKPESIVIAGRATLIAADLFAFFTGYHSSIAALGLTDQGLGDFYELLFSPMPVDSGRLPHSVSAEEIAGIGPDLFITKERNYSQLGTKLEMLGIPVFTLSLEHPDNYIDELLQLGKLLGEEPVAESKAELFRDRIDRVRSIASDAGTSEKERILLLYTTFTDGITSFQVPPDSWIQSYMVQEAGAVPVWSGTAVGSNWQKVSFEQISAWDPDRVYIISYNTPTDRFMAEIAQSRLWSSLKSYRTGNIAAFPADYHNWAQPDSRWILGLEWLSHELHPDHPLNREASMEELIESFYTSFYGVEDQTALDELLSRYQRSLNSLSNP